MKVRLIESPLAIPRYRQVRLPQVAGELSPFAEVEINDENVEPVDFSPVDVVGFTAQSYNAPRAIHLAKRFREMGVQTIVGGPYATAMPKEALQHFDAVVSGEIEGLGARIVGDAVRGKLSGVYRNDKPPDLALCRLPRRDLQKAEEYYWLNYPVEFTRGCPHRCSFCFGRYAFPTFRTRPIEAIERDLAQWDHGLVEAVDLNFGADRQHLLEVCGLLEGFGGFGWFGEATLTSLDDKDVLKALEKSNCKMVFVGIESIDGDTLAGVNKGFNRVEDYRDIIRALQDHGVFVHGGFMWGLDGQTEESFDATARFCEETGLYLASANITAYFPGTQAYKALEEQDRIRTQDLRDFDSARVTVTPTQGGLNESQIYAGARRFLERFYSYRSIFRRSFQNANYRFAQLFDYWGMNLVYRDYYKRWAQRLGRKESPWPAAPEEKDSFPYVGGPAPFIYALGQKGGRFFDGWYRAWDSSPTPTSLLATALLSVLVALSLGGSIALYGLTAYAPADHWPVPWPPVAMILPTFAAATVLCTWLVCRLARSPARGWGALLLLGIAMAPMWGLVPFLPRHAGGWRFLLALLVLLFFLKAWSVLASRSYQRKNLLRVASFILSFPTLDFDGAFKLDASKAQLIRHLPRMALSTVRLTAGLVLGVVLFYLLVTRSVTGSWALVAGVGRLLILYLVLRGLLEYLTAYWRMAGYVVPAPFGQKPLGPAGPAEIWRSWNAPMHHWLGQHVYAPLGGRNRPLSATLVTFVASGALFAAVLSATAPSFPAEVVAFFLVQGVVVALEKTVARKTRPLPRWAQWLFYALAALAFLATAPWLFSVTDRIFL
ncbi:radical SAM protein [Planctomycetota bacterium]